MIEEIKQAFMEYAKQNELPAFNTSYFFARQILLDESILLKYCIVTCLIDSNIIQMVDEKWVIKE
jgi:hypothetical protein